MYNSYFGFSESPFENNFDQRFFFLSRNHKEALAAILYFVRAKKDLAVVCGEVGIGKTMLLNAALERLQGNIEPILIPDPSVERLGVLSCVAQRLGIEESAKKVPLLAGSVREALTEGSQQGKCFVLIIDEAQLLSHHNLNEILYFRQLKEDGQTLLQLLLVGQNEISKRLTHYPLHELRHRASISRILTPFEPSECIEYIDRRLKVVGSDFDSCFEADCKSLIFEMTKGIPGRINQLCDTAFLVTVVEDHRKINRTTLEKSADTSLNDLIFIQQPQNSVSKFWQGLKRVLPAGPGALVAGARELKGRVIQKIGRQTPTTTTTKPQPESPIEAPLIATAAFEETQYINNEREMMVGEGDTLMNIASRLSPENPLLGLDAILLANSDISDMSLVYPGQILKIPELNRNDQTVLLENGLYYWPYACFSSLGALEHARSLLDRIQVKYTITYLTDFWGGTTYRVSLGGYEKSELIHHVLEDSETRNRPWLDQR